MTALLGENSDIFFPKLSDELHLISFSDIAVKYLEARAYEPYICQSEEAINQTPNTEQQTNSLYLVKDLVMELIQIEIKNKKAMAILKGMEKALMIRLIKKNKTTTNDMTSFKGVFSQKKALELANQIDKSRAEWNERTI
ncbi:MAG: hypothetical protein K9G67_05895 [Bacteroidales bacterium]|nr:hypothetical protein [Bacteroidales bacterium]MCF8375867.1 hypothetical protein [Bacteroidales bacterium]